MKKRLVGAGLACVVTCLLLASTTAQGQDLTTMLNLFLRDLYAGTLGATNTITSLKLGGDTTIARTAAGTVSLTGTTPMFQLGGTSSSFPALKQNGTEIQFRLADDSGYANSVAQVVNAIGRYNINGNTAIFTTAPSSPASCGTSPAVTTSNGTAAFVVTGGTGGTATGCTITMPAAATGWNCSINNITGSAAHRADKTTVQTASTTTSVTWEYQTVSTGAATAFTASDTFRGVCFAF